MGPAPQAQAATLKHSSTIRRTAEHLHSAQEQISLLEGSKLKRGEEPALGAAILHKTIAYPLQMEAKRDKRKGFTLQGVSRQIQQALNQGKGGQAEVLPARSKR